MCVKNGGEMKEIAELSQGIGAACTGIAALVAAVQLPRKGKKRKNNPLPGSTRQPAREPPFGYSTKNMNQKTYITGAAAIVLGVLVPVGDLPGPIALLVGSAAAICGAVTLYDVIKQTGRKP